MTHSQLTDTAAVTTTAQRAARARGLGPVGLLLHDPSVTEVMVNGPGPILVDRSGRVESSGHHIEPAQIELLIERILDPLGLHLDRTRPWVDARLPDGSRVNVVIAPAAVGGPFVTIRRFPSRTLPLDAFGCGSVVDLLTRLVAERRTILVTGGTATGKTSLLNALGALFDPNERVVTIEDTAELRFGGGQVVSLEAREPNREGSGSVTLRDLVRNALRMRPDRLVVGEVRGPEALDLLLALNTGHEGSMATCHANSASAALDRLRTLAALDGRHVASDALWSLAATAFDVIVHLVQIDGRRMVHEVTEPAVGSRPGPVLWSRTPQAVA